MTDLVQYEECLLQKTNNGIDLAQQLRDYAEQPCGFYPKHADFIKSLNNIENFVEELTPEQLSGKKPILSHVILMRDTPRIDLTYYPEEGKLNVYFPDEGSFAWVGKYTNDESNIPPRHLPSNVNHNVINGGGEFASVGSYILDLAMDKDNHGIWVGKMEIFETYPQKILQIRYDRPALEEHKYAQARSALLEKLCIGHDFQFFGLNSNASLKEVKEMYHNIVKRFHPDVNKDDPNANNILQRINAVYTKYK